ncbi:zinc ion binding protein [Aureococcus anophagefferens]|nr:zinc ion binding protein [Aureococcus anophagefferens]
MVALAAVGPGAAEPPRRRTAAAAACRGLRRVRARAPRARGLRHVRRPRRPRGPRDLRRALGRRGAPGDGRRLVSEYFGCKIRVIRRGDVTTLAGSGPRPRRRRRARGVLRGPRGVCLDAAELLYAADSGNHCARRLDLASGAVTTVAGDGTRGYADGDAGGARFDEPTAVALDADGALYVADQENRRVRCLRGRTVSTLAGGGAGDSADGVGAAASFSAPNSLHLCPEIRRLYVGDKQCVRVVTLPDLAAAPDAASRRAANLAAAPRNGDAGDGLPPCPPGGPTARVVRATLAGEGADHR